MNSGERAGFGTSDGVMEKLGAAACKEQIWSRDRSVEGWKLGKWRFRVSIWALGLVVASEVRTGRPASSGVKGGARAGAAGGG